jgi:hypothetical protein
MFGRLFAFVFGLGVLLAARAASAEEACGLEKAIGVTEAEGLAIADIVCGPIRSEPAKYPGHHGVRVVKIGAKIVLTLASPSGDKQLVLTSLEEITVAAPRLHEAAAEAKPVEETVDVTNVVGDEARRPKAKPSAVHAWMGVIGAGHQRGAGGGVLLGISAGSERWSFVGDLRVAGESFNKPAALAAMIVTLGSTKIEPDAKFAFVSLAGGVRHHFSASDVAPFVGGGLALDYIGYGTTRSKTMNYGYEGYEERSSGATGLAGYGELGLDVLRTHLVGGAVVMRCDVPAFATERVTSDPNDPTKTVTTRAYEPVLSAGIVLRF